MTKYTRRKPEGFKKPVESTDKDVHVRTIPVRWEYELEDVVRRSAYEFCEFVVSVNNCECMRFSGFGIKLRHVVERLQEQYIDRRDDVCEKIEEGLSKGTLVEWAQEYSHFVIWKGSQVQAVVIPPADASDDLIVIPIPSQAPEAPTVKGAAK